MIETQRPPTLVENIVARFCKETDRTSDRNDWPLYAGKEIRAEAFERIYLHTAVHTVGGLNLRE